MIRKLLVSMLLLALLGLVILPALAYAVGQVIIGPYEGTGGLPGYLGSLYRALRQGHPSAVVLVSSPLVVVVTWVAIGWIMRRPGTAASEKE